VLSLPPSVRIWMSMGPADMRRSFDGLSALVRDVLGQDPLSGHLFVFRNRRGDRLKILWWDRDGFALWYKRLESGTFSLPPGTPGARHVSVTASQLSLILDGIDPATVRRKKRYDLVSSS
jgi:transposase